MTNLFATVAGVENPPSTEGLLGNDDSPSGAPLSAVLVSGPAHSASFTLNADGTFTYSPVANYSGTDGFTYRATDEFGHSDLATVRVTVNEVNDAPGGGNNTVTTLENTGYVFASATLASPIWPTVPRT